MGTEKRGRVGLRCGGGFIVNPAPGMYNASFGGVLAQYTVSPRWTLGVELFRQNALATDQPGYTLLNAGVTSTTRSTSACCFPLAAAWPARGIPLRTWFVLDVVGGALSDSKAGAAGRFSNSSAP